MIPLTMLKDSLSLAEKMSQSISQLRRKLIKPVLPPQFSKLAEKSEKSSEWLFGDSVSESVENLEKKSKLKSLLKGKKDSGKRKYAEESSNSNPSPNPRRRFQNTGKTSEVLNPGHRKQARMIKIIISRVRNTAVTKPDIELG